MPPEWAKHSATLLIWPSNPETWPGERLPRVEKVYLEIIEALHFYEPVLLLVDPSADQARLRDLIANEDIDLKQITILETPVNDVWARDCGPIMVEGENGPVITDWEYNAWGGKYPPFDSDNRIPSLLAEKSGLIRVEPGMVLEGGSIETNGKGTFLTTESVLLNTNRNPHLNREQIEDKLNRWLGAEQVIWLKEGLAGDDTDGHIDDLSRFLNSNTILTMVSEDPDDINYDALQENQKILRNARNRDGELFHIVTLPLPHTRIEGTTVDGSEHVPASYANFYIANGVVLVPVYDERYDEEALDLFNEFFPERDVIGIPCADLVWGQGSIHCITQQLYGIRI